MDKKSTQILPEEIAILLLKAIYLKNIKDLEEIFAKYPDINLFHRLSPEKENTVLHMSSYLDSIELCKYFIEIV